MMRKLLATMVAGLFVLAAASAALCADVVGTVSDVNAKPVPGIQIIVENAAGKIVGKILTDTKGYYRLTGLDPGKYTYVLDPQGTSFKGGSAVSYLGDKGLTIDWRVSAGAPPSAMAAEGTSNSLLAADPFGLSSGAFAALVVGAMAAMGVGAYAAAGGFSGEHHPPPPHPHSPSM